MEQLRVGIIGLGQRGYGLTEQIFLNMDGIRVTAVCDVYPDRVARAADLVERSDHPRPFEATDYRELAQGNRVDCVIVAASWSCHTEISCFFLEQGIPVGCEVGGAYTLEECFHLVRTQEKTGTPYMFLENCNYGQRELMVLNMVRQGLFGQILHCSGGYCHDLREEITTGRENRHYRLQEYLSRNCENYPSHELGPIMQVLDINRSNRFLTLSSTASRSAGLHEYCLSHRPEDDDLRRTEFAQGDVVTTVITCSGGQTITLTLDTCLPRPYCRGFTVQGTRGMYTEACDSVFLDGIHNGFDFNWKQQWGNAEQYAKEYDHPLWASITQEERDAGHGGMDYLCYRDFFDHVQSGAPMPIDVYDAAAIMCITPLSADSITSGGMPVRIPDFRTHTQDNKEELP